jgi:hypothetical protein
MKIKVTLLSEPPRILELDGRLVATIERPAPRWSAYVHDLRKLGIQIETEMEPHDGAYSGRHARYRLACDAQIASLEPWVRK